MKHLFHFAYFFHLFPTKAKLFDFWNNSVDSAVQKTGETLNIDLPSRLLKDGKLFELGIWMSPSSPLMWDQHHLAAMALGELRIGHWKKPHFSDFTIATCQSTKIQDCLEPSWMGTIMDQVHCQVQKGNPVAPCWGDHFSIGSNVLLPTCPASSECSVKFSFGISEIGSVPLPVPLLCESNQDANQGACSACFRCFSVCSCNMIIVAVHDLVWHHLTSGNCTAWSQLLELHSKSEVAFWIFHQRIPSGKLT